MDEKIGEEIGDICSFYQKFRKLYQDALYHKKYIILNSNM